MTFRALEKIANDLSAHDRGGKGGVGPRDSPLLALILYFIAHVEDDLPVLAGQVYGSLFAPSSVHLVLRSDVAGLRPSCPHGRAILGRYPPHCVVPYYL